MLTEGREALAEEIEKEFSEELQREENTVEALLFTMGRSVSVEEIAIALNTGSRPAEDAAERLLRRYKERNGGILIQKLEGRYQMCTNPEEYPGLIRVVKQPKKPVLTEVMLETLAIVAYRQPVTKAEIEKIRGVKSDHAVNRLVEYELICEAGRLNAPGRPALFTTTEEFLRRFGIRSLEELPTLAPEVQAEIETEVAEEIADVLGTAEKEDAEPHAEEEHSSETAHAEEEHSMERAEEAEAGVHAEEMHPSEARETEGEAREQAAAAEAEGGDREQAAAAEAETENMEEEAGENLKEVLGEEELLEAVLFEELEAETERTELPAMEIGHVRESLKEKTEEETPEKTEEEAAEELPEEGTDTEPEEERETAEEGHTDAYAKDTEEANAGRPEQNAGTV